MISIEKVTQAHETELKGEFEQLFQHFHFKIIIKFPQRSNLDVWDNNSVKGLNTLQCETSFPK